MSGKLEEMHLSINYAGTWDKNVSGVGFVLWSSGINLISRKMFVRIAVFKISSTSQEQNSLFITSQNS